MDAQQQSDGTTPSQPTPRIADGSMDRNGAPNAAPGSTSSFMSLNYAGASPESDQRPNLVLQQPNFGSPALNQQSFPNANYGQSQSQRQDSVPTNAPNDTNPISNPSNPANRVQPHPDTPLPPAVQAQFYNRFGAQPPQTHGQLQAFLRHAAQVAHQARVNAQARGVNVGNSPAGMNTGAGTAMGTPGMVGTPSMTQMASQADSPATSQVGLASTPTPATMPIPGQNQYSNPGPGPDTTSSPSIPHIPRSSSTSGHNTPQTNVMEVPKTPLNAANSDLGQGSTGPLQGPGSRASNTPDRRDAGTPSSSVGGVGGLGNRASVGLEADLNEAKDKDSPSARSDDRGNSFVDQPIFRPRLLSGSDTSNLHAALAGVIKSPGSTNGAGLLLPSDRSAGTTQIDGLGRIPAGVDREAIRKQMQALRDSQNRRSSLSNQPITAMSPGYNPGPMQPMGMIASSPHSQRGQMPASSPAPASEVAVQKTETEPDTPKVPISGVEPLDQHVTKSQENNEDEAERRPSTAENNPGTPNSASGATLGLAQRRPAHPNQAAFAMHFLNSLRQFVHVKNIPVPANLFLNEPPDPNVPGSAPTPPGALDIFGKKIELFRLYFTVIQMGGFNKVGTINGWARLATAWGFPPVFSTPWTLFPLGPQTEPPAISGETMNPADMLSNVYQAFLLDFEEQSRHSQAAQAAKNQQQLQQQQQQNQQTQMPIATETLTTASTQSQQAPTEAKPQNVPQDQTKPSSAVTPVLTSDTNQHSLDAIHKASTPKQTESTEDVKDSQKAVGPKQAPIPRPASRADSVSSQVGSTSSMPSSRAEGELLAQRQRMLLQAQTKAMLQGMPASAFPGPYGGSPGPSSAGPSVEKTSLNGSVQNGEIRKQEGSEKQLSAGEKRKLEKEIESPVVREETPEPLPKRIRYKIEYRPHRRIADTYGGWDIDSISKIHQDNRLAREALMVEDLGRVDIESLCMSIRSRIPSELSYALTVLRMLSMPGKGEDKGGLGLGHCDDLLDDLVDLIEEETFGESGWKQWAQTLEEDAATNGNVPPDRLDAGNATHSEMLVSAQVDEYAAMINADGQRRPPSRRAELVLLVVGLLRNFSLMADNYSIMTQHGRFVEIMIRVCDVRLTLSTSVDKSKGCNEAVVFKRSDHLRIREDVLDIFHGLSSNLSLTVLPLDAVGLMMELALSHLKVSQTDNINDRLFRGRTELTGLPDRAILALEVLTQTSCADQNRRILRQLDGRIILDAFLTCLKYLAFDAEDAKTLAYKPAMVEVQVKLAFCLYNLAFVGSLAVRAQIRETVGVLPVLGTSIHLLSRAPPAHPYALIVRCLSETLEVLNGPDELMGERRQLTFGSQASARGLKGWNDSQQTMEQGILAAYEDRLLIDYLAVGQAAGRLDQTTFGAISRAVWAL